ncbi:PREDICTED: DDB1- and CUL4-associated factor 13 [Nicrophorus vespilloides]|uniref:DDB1- and CUL4-associated factor 13 n=1 Tax=Nicrophorus vespilloides TaxID=110193 RepID=A0ABM1MQQ5_NICVS|nr:PREDICTED: DDB1- and CUL4-associated factor 13 [Nicrophorus vespilloides]
MKIKVLSRDPNQYIRETKSETHKLKRNFDPKLHQFEAAREYVRALNATKLDKVFAKPFIGNLDGHRDSISCISKHPTSLSLLLSGAYNGELRVWDIPQKKCIREIQAHDGVLRGISYTNDGQHFFSIGDDKNIKMWSSQAPLRPEDEEPANTILSKSIISGISHHFTEDKFATCGEVCQLWEESRNSSIKTYEWGVDTLHDVAFNPVQSNLLGACAADRSIILYDIRETKPLRKLVMALKSNKICWNPMEAFNFTVASEDFNLYTFDTRNLKCPVTMHVDHVSAVMSLDYAPTGKEFVTGSYDKTIRIFEVDKVHSREVYHTKRMQRLTSVQWTLDNKYILSASDEMNIRIWKARASEKLGPLKQREKAALNYSEALKDKYAAHPKIKKIAQRRHVPKHVYNAQMEMKTIRKAHRRKDANRKLHSKPGSTKTKPEILKKIVREDA